MVPGIASGGGISLVEIIRRPELLGTVGMNASNPAILANIAVQSLVARTAFKFGKRIMRPNINLMNRLVFRPPPGIGVKVVMASNISVFLRFSDGTFGSLRSTVTESSTAFGQYTEITTEGGDLNQTEGISAGQAFNGQTVTHAYALCATDNATTAAFVGAYFEDTNGSIMVPIQGGGQHMSGLPMLKKPIRLMTGCRGESGTTRRSRRGANRNPLGILLKRQVRSVRGFGSR